MLRIRLVFMLTLSAPSTGGLLDEYALEDSLSFDEPSMHWKILSVSMSQAIAITSLQDLRKKYSVGWCFSSKEKPSG